MKSKMKYSAIVIVTVALFVVLHLLIPPELVSETPESSLSALALRLGFPVAAVLWGVAAYSCVAFVFWRIEERIPGRKNWRGIRYGGAVAALWLLGYVMCAAKSQVSFLGEFVGGLCDALPVLLMGWMLGRFASGEEIVKISISPSRVGRRDASAVVFFMLSFFIFRIAGYWLNLIDVGLWENTWYTLTWTMAMGACIGSFYLLLGRVVQEAVAVAAALKFGFYLFGLSWGIFILFFPLILQGHLANTVWMFAADALSSSIAYYLAEKRYADKMAISEVAAARLNIL